MRTSPSPSGILTAISLLLTSVSAHSWTEDIRIIASNGTFIGEPGFPRAFLPRDGIRGMKPDIELVYNVANAGPNANLCRYAPGNQTAGYPVLSAAAGDPIAIRYLENGHVSLDGPAGSPSGGPPRPAHGGIVWIYGTKQTKVDEKFTDVHHKWNFDGTGGDKRGRLLATRPYDDGECFQKNDHKVSQTRKKEFPKAGKEDDDLVCQSDIRLPLDAGVDGQYTLYWVWEWPLPDLQKGGVKTPETYTSCMEINMVAKSNPAIASGSFKDGQLGNTHALKVQLDNQFLIDPDAVPDLKPAPSAKNPNPSPPQVAPQQPSQPSSSAASSSTVPSSTQTRAPTSVSPSSSSSRPQTQTRSPSSSLVTFPLLTPSSKPTSTTPANSMTSPTVPSSASQPGNDRFITITVTASAKPDNGGNTVTVTATEFLMVVSSSTMEVVPSSKVPKPAPSSATSSSSASLPPIRPSTLVSSTLSSSTRASSSQVSASLQLPSPTTSKAPTQPVTADIKPSGPPVNLRPFDPVDEASKPVATPTSTPSKNGPTVYSRLRRQLRRARSAVE